MRTTTSQFAVKTWDNFTQSQAIQKENDLLKTKDNLKAVEVTANIPSEIKQT